MPPCIRAPVSLRWGRVLLLFTLLAATDGKHAENADLPLPLSSFSSEKQAKRYQHTPPSVVFGGRSPGTLAASAAHESFVCFVFFGTQIA